MAREAQGKKWYGHIWLYDTLSFLNKLLGEYEQKWAIQNEPVANASIIANSTLKEDKEIAPEE